MQLQCCPIAQDTPPPQSSCRARARPARHRPRSMFPNRRWLTKNRRRNSNPPWSRQNLQWHCV
eukprot:3627103-Lingulodinium_polyedra.AAC.1